MKTLRSLPELQKCKDAKQLITLCAHVEVHFCVCMLVCILVCKFNTCELIKSVPVCAPTVIIIYLFTISSCLSGRCLWRSLLLKPLYGAGLSHYTCYQALHKSCCVIVHATSMEFAGLFCINCMHITSLFSLCNSWYSGCVLFDG